MCVINIEEVQLEFQQPPRVVDVVHGEEEVNEWCQSMEEEVDAVCTYV
jgi:hypothetical protein